MRLITKAALLIAAVTMGGRWTLAADTTTDSLAVVKEKVDTRKAVLVDVRERSEWDAGHVDGAILLPLSELQSGLDTDQLGKRLPKDKVLYTHCVVGKRSLAAANILERQGYKVRSLKPGYKELVAAGFKKANP
ncbi:MAG: rhodanese-like domain-containing protein [Planctomycetaceae bacterium]|nr:rhodanese-like domain-containing protein [Planctomycetaceae bacterium]